MTSRMRNPASVLPDAMDGIGGIYRAMHKGGLPPQVLELVHLRVSQINGCGACVVAGTASATKAGVPPEQLTSLAAWRATPYFSGAERAALELAESATRLHDHTDPVPDPVWECAAAHYDEEQLAALVLMVATTNFFNRLNITVRQVAGAGWQ